MSKVHSTATWEQNKEALSLPGKAAMCTKIAANFSEKHQAYGDIEAGIESIELFDIKPGYVLTINPGESRNQNGFGPWKRLPNEDRSNKAAKARAACLAALKERLLERANIIQRRLDEENSALSKKQANFQRSRDHMEGADEAFEKFCSEAMFRISILEQRLSRHEESALSKYAALDQKLRQDPRLEILTS